MLEHLGVIVTVLIGAASLWGTWTLNGYKLAQLKEQISELRAEMKAEATAQADLRRLVDATDAKIETVRNKQGDRLGIVEKATDRLEGKFEGVAAMARRSKTAATGNPKVPA